MRSLLPNRKGAGTAVMLAAIAAIGLFSARLARQQASPTPFELFQQLLPVIRHPRCANCHGGVDPISGRGHLPGAIDTVRAHTKTFQECSDCHQKGWELPRRDHSFVGKTDRELCALFSEFAMKQGRPLFIDGHLRHDELVMAGFEGEAGGPLSPADPPRMKQGAFVKLGEDWYDKGQHTCEVLGTITLEESVAATDSFSLGPISTTQNYIGKRTVTVAFRDGKYQADITTDYTMTEVSKQRLINPKTGQPCYLTHTRNERQLGTTSGGASVTIKDTILFADTDPPQTDYRIDVALPPETTKRTESRTVNDGCGLGVPFPAENETRSFTWGRASFIIEGHLQDPRIDFRAGGCERVAKSTDINTDNLERDPGHPCFKFKHLGNSWYLGLMERTLPKTFHDDVAVPFHLRAFWNLKYTK